MRHRHAPHGGEILLAIKTFITRNRADSQGTTGKVPASLPPVGNFVIPAKLMQARDVKAIYAACRPGFAASNLPPSHWLTHHLCDSLRQLADGAVHASADVNVLTASGRVLLPLRAPKAPSREYWPAAISSTCEIRASACRCPHHHHLRRVALRGLMAQQRQDLCELSDGVSCGPYRLVGITGQ